MYQKNVSFNAAPANPQTALVAPQPYRDGSGCSGNGQDPPP